MTLLLLAHTMTLALACKNLEPSNTGVDGGNAGGTADAGADAGVDAGADAGVDAGADAGVDGGTGADAGADAGVDGGTGADAGADAGVDAGADAGFDAGMAGIPCDPAIDAGANAYSLRIDQFGNVFGVRQTCASWPMFFQGDVFARRFPADAAAEPEIKINLYSPDFCGRVSLETYGPRNAAIIWPMRENGGDGNYNLYQKQFVASVDGDGGWTTTDQLTTTNTEHYYNGVGAGVGATGRLAVVGTKTVDQY
ncbi:MAG: hypothetical protein HYY84_15355, partial [Deltaproteobacteria bacterium]|nr:hypothetical protein [Deltaproteobacteria bacterium]